MARRGFEPLVERLRSGPPVLSPYAVPNLDAMLNTLEFFVHHEDIRRAQPDWSPRTLGDDAEKQLWTKLRTAGKALTRNAPVGVTIENDVTGSTVTLKDATPSVTVRGRPSEVTLFMFGRSQQAIVELVGEADAVVRLRETSLGV